MRLPTAVVLAALATVACRHERTALQFPSAPVILISVDTLRADHLPAYGYSGVSTPNIDALRHDGTLFRNAYATVPMTLPSHVTMLTGLLPPEHGVRDNVGFRFDAKAHPSIPSILKNAGYATGGFISSYVLRGGTPTRSTSTKTPSREGRARASSTTSGRERSPLLSLRNGSTSEGTSHSSSSSTSTSRTSPTIRPSRSAAGTRRVLTTERSRQPMRSSEGCSTT